MSTTVRTLARQLAAGIATVLAATACSRHPVSASNPAGATSASRAAATAQDGYATFMAAAFHGRRTASGETFDERRLVAAHRTLPFGSIVRVTNMENGRSVTVRIVDRGPYGRNYREGAIVDLSRAAARRRRMLDDGQVRARVDVLTVADGQ